MKTNELATMLINADFAIIPCYPASHKRAKSPMVLHGQYDAKTDPDIVGKWFGGAAEKLIGVPCKANGFFVVDVDGPEGKATWGKLVEQYGLPEPGPTQRTPHGQHYLFQYPDFEVPGGVKKLGDGLDLRANNYICTGGDGSGYEWLIPFTEPIPEAPQWLLNKIKALRPNLKLKELDRPSNEPPTDPQTVIGYWIDKFAAQASVGNRNDCAYRLGLQLNWAGVPLEQAVDAGQDFIHVIPQSKDGYFSLGEYTTTIRSAYKAPPREAATLPRSVTNPATNTPGSEPKAAEKPQIESENIPDKPKVSKELKTEEEAEKVPEFSTWADSEEVLGPIEWDWPGWLSKGFLHILVGMTGEGKSRVALRIAGVYLIGLDWPDGTPYEDEPAFVLWCEAEAGQAMNLDRAKAMKLPTDKIYSPLGDPLDDFRLNNDHHRAKLAAMALWPKIKLIIVDSLSGADPTAEKSTEDAKNVNWLAGLARDTQKPIILTHHLRKRGLFDVEGEVSLDRVRGISTILQYARVIWAIDTPNLEDKDTKRLSVIKSNLAKKPEPIGFTIDDEITFTEAPSKPKVETLQDRGVDLLLALLASGPVPVRTIEQEFNDAGLSKRTLWEAKKALAIVSIKTSKSGWQWSLPSLLDDADD